MASSTTTAAEILGEPDMWQHHYILHAMRMQELLAEAKRERLWHRQDLENGRISAATAPGVARIIAARGIASLSRGTTRIARRLDARVSVEAGPPRLLRDA
jgi:hypothetical protein